MKAKQISSATPPLVLSYLRFSRREQKKGDSTRRQTEGRQRWLDAHKLTLSKGFADEGVSAYRGKNAATGDLSRLLRLIEQGKIPAGSILLVESLDRLSRADILSALNLFTGIINAGVKVVTLCDGKEFTRESVTENPTDLMVSILVLMRANEESRTKAMRSAANWERKRQRLLKGERCIATRMVPAWLQIEDGKIVAIEWKAAIVRRIFRMALSGYGLGVITRKLNGEGVTPISKIDGKPRRSKDAKRLVGERWHSTYVHAILKSRAVVGEFEVHTFVNGERKRVGVVKGYYPSIVDRRTFEAVQSLLIKRRSRKVGGPSGRFTNIFNGLLFDEQGEPWTTYEKKSRFQRERGEPYRCIVSLGALLGRQPKQINLRLCVFETAFFDIMLRCYLHAFVGNRDDDKADKIAQAKAEVTELENKIALIQEQAMAPGGDVASVVQLLAKMEAKREAKTDQLQALERDSNSSDYARLHRLFSSFIQIARGTLDDGHRVELQAIIRQLVKRITLRLAWQVTDGKQTIVGDCRIEPIAGKSIDFVLTYRPFTATRKSPPISRAIWRVTTTLTQSKVAAEGDVYGALAAAIADSRDVQQRRQMCSCVGNAK
jgi:DNA invertase Pin-like site-specific DNA recombinase